MRKKFLRFLVLLLIMLLGPNSFAPQVLAAQSSPTLPPKLMISEFQTGGLSLSGAEDGKMEFVELYNPSNNPLDVTGWKLEYLSASHTGGAIPTRVLTTFEGHILPRGYALISYDAYLAGADSYFGVGNTANSGLLARGGGHLRVTDGAGMTIDLVAWGNGVTIGDWWHTPEVLPGLSAQRILPTDPAYTSGLVFAPPNTDKTPRGGGYVMPESPETEPIELCDDLVLSEILPNPSGVDAGHEFIEIYNPTDAAIPMRGCELRLGDEGRRFALPDEPLAPFAYRSFTDAETGIILPNATAQPVWLLSSQAEESVLYPNNMKDDQSWSRMTTSSWGVTLQPTPGAMNVHLEEVMPSQNESELDDAVAALSCPLGKERNPETNRCRKFAQGVVAPEPCKTGYERNIETGRCRKKAVSNTPAACPAGQQRNPETGRCRGVLSASTAPKACPEGQERNPETNRCRKFASTTQSTLTPVQDVRSSARANDIRWWIAGILVSGAIGYALYEWRQEIGQSFVRLRLRIRKGSG